MVAVNDSNAVRVENIRNMVVQDIWKAFMKTHKRNSFETARGYDTKIREFFKLITGKDIEFLTVDDIQGIMSKDVKNKYVDVLLERSNKADTIKTKLHCVKSFYDELLKNEIQVNPMALKIKFKKSVKHHEALSLDEYLNLVEFMKDEDDGLEKYLYTKLLFQTGGRKTATVNLTWDNFSIKKDLETGKNIWVINFVGKGQKDTDKPISDEFYEELRQLESPKLFPVLSESKGSYKRYERSLKKYGKMIGKDNISIHTLKATSITIGYMLTKDINLCKQLGSHESLATTEIYLKPEKAYTKQLSYNMSRELDESILDNMPHEELLKFIKSNEDIKMSILMRMGN